MAELFLVEVDEIFTQVSVVLNCIQMSELESAPPKKKKKKSDLLLLNTKCFIFREFFGVIECSTKKACYCVDV